MPALARMELLQACSFILLYFCLNILVLSDHSVSLGLILDCKSAMRFNFSGI